VIIATPRHISAFDLQLGTLVDVANARVRDQLVVFDAEASRARLMVGGQPDRDVFRAFVNAILDRAQVAGNGRVRLFGEMVNLLCDRDPEAAAQPESLWNEMIAERRVSLLCAYRLDNFDRHIHRGLLHQINRSHSHVVPVEHYHRLESAVDSAYHEVFGAEGDTPRCAISSWRGRPRRRSCPRLRRP
jgi:MEDS: MEthanogen/methylotroph, DcmR Sensory domain